MRRQNGSSADRRPEKGGPMPLNTIQLVGNLVDAPELRHTGDGTPVANLTVAVSRSVRRDGEWHQIQDGFFRCPLWQDLATNAAESLSKGDRVIVVGKLQQCSYEAEDGRRYVIEVQASHVGPDLGFGTAKVTRRKKSSTRGED